MMVKSSLVRFDLKRGRIVPSRLTFQKKLALTCDLTTIDFDL